MQLSYTWWLVYSGKHYALMRVSLSIYFFAYNKCIILMTKSDGLVYFYFENYTISHDWVFERYLFFRHYADSSIVVELHLHPIKLAICFCTLFIWASLKRSRLVRHFWNLMHYFYLHVLAHTVISVCLGRLHHSSWWHQSINRLQINMYLAAVMQLL